MEIIRELRKSSGLTLREVQEATQISNAYLSQLETGKIKKPSINVVYRLAKLYCVDFEKLIIDTGLVVATEIEPVKTNPSMNKRLDDLEKRIDKLELESLK